MRRRACLLALAAPLLPAPTAAAEPRVTRRDLVFPRDHGAHLPFGIEWWYVTGALQGAGAAPFGFQVTFFRTRTGFDGSGRFAPRQLLFAHAALSDIGAQRQRHAERLARWNGDADAPLATASEADTAVHIGDWRLRRSVGGYETAVHDRNAGFGLALTLAPTQPLLLQGDRGVSRKGPDPDQVSHYYSQPQLAAVGDLTLDGAREPVRGVAWLDHEWSQTLMHPEAVGWDWIGINLADGGALTAFRLRRADGSTLWSGGSFRPGGRAPARIFGNDEVTFTPGRRWTSPATGAVYPVTWTVRTPAGRHEVHAMLDAQEIDARRSTGTVYWEGLSELRRPDGGVAGIGYLEMTGYAGRLRL